MKFKKMDTGTFIFYLIISIVIPPLFIINLILFLVQVIPKMIKRKKEQKEIEEFNQIDESIDNKYITIPQSVKDKLLPLLNIISNSYLGEDSIKIRQFVTICMLNDTIAQVIIFDFMDFLISLDDLTPANLRLTEMQEALEILYDLL